MNIIVYNRKLYEGSNHFRIASGRNEEGDFKRKGDVTICDIYTVYTHYTYIWYIVIDQRVIVRTCTIDLERVIF